MDLRSGLTDAAGLSAATVVLVEGDSDRRAVEAMARRHGRSLHGVAVVPMGGVTNVRYFVELFHDRRLAGLYDAAEEGYVRRALTECAFGPAGSPAGLAGLGFHACRADLEDELIRALGTRKVEQLVETVGDLRSFRLFQRQPAQRDRPLARQLHRFIGTRSGRKSHYATLLADAVDPARTPPPLDRLLALL
ncbi:TOPRIM nucleotidyl transferase/hydrolase domain-containing protein [Micromonospora sp. NPDC093277]|uniref:TOPRIM nucleotidyl transferase/hydrolase domain-containing protein n=1 Tax=Micromonospora sp. NPDC093277 TaxID=3364291 RepID=UPI003811D689